MSDEADKRPRRVPRMGVMAMVATILALTGTSEPEAAPYPPAAPAPGGKPEDDYHTHLDVCSRCRTKPFDMCGLGASLLERAATGGGR